MKLLASIALFLALSGSAIAAIPWNSTVNTIAPSGGAATCTLPAVCIFNLTGNLTSLSLSGGTVGSSYTLIYVQDNTGGRTFTVPHNIIPGAVGTIPAIQSTANNYSVWVVEYDGTNYELNAAYDNISIADVYRNQIQSLGTAISTQTTQLQVQSPATISVVFPGMTTNGSCSCVAQINPALSPHNLPTQWQKGVFAVCLPDTNAATCAIVNPTSSSITPDQDTLNIRGRL